VPLKRRLRVVQLTLYFFDVAEKFGINCLLRSVSANCIRSSVVELSMINDFGIGGQIAKIGVVESRDWSTRLEYGYV
jgi:hypothetical protein